MATDVTEQWRLRAARMDDLNGLHALASLPPVYRFLFDGVAPDRDFLTERLRQRVAAAPGSVLGLWFLEGQTTRYAGCVELRDYAAPRATEITWLLHPAYWRRGLALRMAWSVMVRAFGSGGIDMVIAGADQPNTASIGLMRRLGMRFHKDVTYPLGAGVEFMLHREDEGPQPRPEPIVFRGPLE